MCNNHAVKFGLVLSFLTSTLLFATPSLAAATIEQNTDRPGSDYAGFELPAPDPALCRKACDDDANCKAYTYVKPGVQGPSARCYLKNPVPMAQANNCCVSGVMAVEPVTRAGRQKPATDITILSPEASAGGAQLQREFPAAFLYANDDSAELEAYFKGRFRNYGLAFDWSALGANKVRFRWLNKSDAIASARWEVSTIPFAPVATRANNQPIIGATDLRSSASAIFALSRSRTQTLLDSGPAPIAQIAMRPDQARAPFWSEFEINLRSFEPHVLQGLVVDPVKTDKIVAGLNPNALRPDLYLRVVVFGADGKPLDAESNMIHIKFQQIVTGALKIPKFRPVVAGIEATIPWRAYLWNYQCFAVYSRDYVIPHPYDKDKAWFSAKRGNKVDLCKKHDTSWYEDIGKAFVDAFSSLFEFVKSTVNWAADQYNKAKATALSAVISGLKGVTGCGDICQTVVGATLDTGLAMAGLPPSLPDFDELVTNLEEGQIDALTEIMTDAAAAQGVPLSDIPGVKNAIKDQLTNLKNELKSQISEPKVGGSLPLIADLSKQYQPMTVVFMMRNNGAGKSGDVPLCISQASTPDPQRSIPYIPRCTMVPALVPGGEIPVSVTIDAFDDPLAWEALMPTVADYKNIITKGPGPINAKTSAGKAARDAWTIKYVHSSHSFDVSLGHTRIGGLACSKGGESCVMTP